MTRTTVAVVRPPPALLDLEESVRRATGHITEAAREGTALVVFPETWLTGLGVRSRRPAGPHGTAPARAVAGTEPRPRPRRRGRRPRPRPCGGP
ncbi:nitrilase-related carbon-nitrogen hydrolase [Streptomyces sp. NWU49]|uniref:nitrilase-related carbon-nitrogen hydrolase n=1 Tax=Streptomyces sp. NWU49 TaxID=2201153 RepID=UPI001C638328